MNPEPVIEHLYENKALNVMQQLSLVKIKSKTEQSAKLIKILEQHKEWVYQCMIDALKRSGQAEVLNTLGDGKYWYAICRLVYHNVWEAIIYMLDILTWHCIKDELPEI